MFFTEFFEAIIRILKDLVVLNIRLLRIASHKPRVIAMRHDWDLEKERKNKFMVGKLNGLYILDKGEGEFTLRFQFGKTELEGFTLNQDRFDNGDFYQWDVKRLYLTNSSQPGKTLSVIVEENN